MPRPNEGPYIPDKPNAHGVWEIRWTENGRSKRKSTGTTNRRSAQLVLAEAIRAADAGPLTGAITCARVLDAYLKDKAGVCAPWVLEIGCEQLKAHFGHMAVNEVEQADVDAYIRKRAAGDITWTDPDGRARGGRPAKGKGTMRRELALLRTAVNHCVKMKTFKDQGGRTLLHAADLNFVDLPAAPPPRDRWLTRAEASAFLAACQPSDQARLSREYRYIAMLLYTASRTSPVETLTWDRILLDRDLINFRAPGERITKKRRGYVPIGAELKPILERAYRERTSDFYLDEPGQPEAGWRRAAKAAGLVDDTGKLTVTPHVLRHTWATWAAQDGVSLFEIAGVLHDTIATVERAYAHHCPDHLRNAVDRNILAAAPPQQTDEEKIMAMLEEVLGRDLVSETRA